jgi:hypothetical protein
MRSFVSLLVLCSALNLFALQLPKPVGSPTTASAGVATQPALPAITFSSVGPVSSIQMTGTVNWTYGSDQQTGTVTLQANANGQSRMTLGLPSGNRIETQNAFSESQRQCSWSGVDAVAHTTPAHQCWGAATWFLPQITMQAGAGATDDVASVAQTGDANIIRLHHERHVADVSDALTGQLIAHLSAVDLDINAATGLPVMLAFAAHPDNDAGVDIGVEVHYSAYSTFSGVTIPTHIQKFINHSLVLDLQIADVQVQLSTPTTTSASSSTLQ